MVGMDTVSYSVDWLSLLLVGFTVILVGATVAGIAALVWVAIRASRR